MSRARTPLHTVILVLLAVLVGCGRTSGLPADDAATYQLLTGANGQDFLRQISFHAWDDGGKSAAERLSWITRDAQSLDAGAAERAGLAAHAIATFLADNRDELARISAGWFGLQHRAVGQLNPALVNGYASALIPFQGALVGDVKSVRGFSIIGDGLDLSSARNVFAVIDTNADAGKRFNEAAYERVRGCLQTYAEAVVSKDVDNLVDIRHAADLAGVVEGGQRKSGNSAVDTRRAQYSINWAGYELAAAMGARPGGPDIPDQYFTADGRLKRPAEVSVNDLPRFATALEIFTFNHGFPGLGSDFRRWYDDAAGK